MFERIYDLLFRFTGCTAEELKGQPWEVHMRRLVLGLLVVASGFFAAVMLTLAVARIDPLNPARWLYSALAGMVYFAVIAGYDSLFVASTESARGKSVWLRIGLSLIMMAFTASTLDAAIAGKRLLSEIDKRRTEATLAAQERHRKVYALDEKQEVAAGAVRTIDTLEKDLAGDPQTADFEDAVASVSSAMEALRQLQVAAVPKLEELRSAIVNLRQQLADLNETQEERRQSLTRKLTQARAQRMDLERRVGDKKRALESAAARADQLRREWRAEKSAQRTQAQHERLDAVKAQRVAQAAAERDSLASRDTNSEAFQANLVEEMVAFWSLAGRERGYLAIGLIVWMAAVTFELLAILTKLLLKPARRWPILSVMPMRPGTSDRQPRFTRPLCRNCRRRLARCFLPISGIIPKALARGWWTMAHRAKLPNGWCKWRSLMVPLGWPRCPRRKRAMLPH